MAGLPTSVPGLAIDRMCAGAMTAVTTTAGGIAFGAYDVVIAGGVEHVGHHPVGEGMDPNPRMVADRVLDPSAMSMGSTAENLHDRFPALTKQRADAYAVRSQGKLAQAYADGRGQRRLVPVATRSSQRGWGLATADEPPRPGTTMADLALEAMTKREQGLTIGKAGHAAFRRFGEFKVPTFAFCNGAALGGGVELGLDCGYRTISGSVAAFGLPECFLSLVPGWGGTQLLPNLVGADGAVTVIIENPLNQNRISARQVRDRGIADVMFESADFLEQSLVWAARVLTWSRCDPPPGDRPLPGPLGRGAGAGQGGRGRQGARCGTGSAPGPGSDRTGPHRVHDHRRRVAVPPGRHHPVPRPQRHLGEGDRTTGPCPDVASVPAP